MPNSRLFPAAAWVISLCLCSLAPAQELATPSQAYARAVHHYSAGHMRDARRELTALVGEHPHWFAAYGLYWEVIGKLEDVAARDVAVRESLRVLDAVARNERSEDFYYAIMAAHEHLGVPDRAEEWRREAIERLPRSKIAQQGMLDRADTEPDVVTACASLQRYIDAFPENASWRRRTARKRFNRMADAPDRFELKQLVDAAEQLDRLTRTFVATFGSPSRRLVVLNEITQRFLTLDPARVDGFVERARRYITETAASTDEFDALAIDAFRPLQMLAFARLENWQAAATAAEGLFSRRGLTAEVPLPFGAKFTEAELRHVHARALYALGRAWPGPAE